MADHIVSPGDEWIAKAMMVGASIYTDRSIWGVLWAAELGSKLRFGATQGLACQKLMQDVLEQAMTETLNHLKWAAWGVVDVEALDRQQRRNYLKKCREELAAVGWTLHPGGTTQTPWYLVLEHKSGDSRNKHTTQGTTAFKDACAWLLEQLGEKQDVGSNEVDAAS